MHFLQFVLRINPRVQLAHLRDYTYFYNHFFVTRGPLPLDLLDGDE